MPRRPPPGPERGARKADGGGPRPTGRGRARRRRAVEARAALSSPTAILVEKPDHGRDLAHFLADHLPGSLSIRAVRRLLADGRCRIDGTVETFGSRKLARGEVVDCPPPEPDTGTTCFEPQRVLLDADGLLAYDKPAGLAVTPTESGRQWNLQKLLADRLGPVHPAHRLDADTSGIVLFARDRERLRVLEDLFREHAVTKTYAALVRGQPPRRGERRTYLIRKRHQAGFEIWGTGKGPDAKEAITTWRVVEPIAPHGARVRVEPATGRYHQIRIHFAEMGHPLFGDRLYGDRRDPIDCRRHLLHADRLELPHPDTGDRLRITCKLPADFKRALRELRKSSG